MARVPHLDDEIDEADDTDAGDETTAMIDGCMERISDLLLDTYNKIEEEIYTLVDEVLSNK